MMAWQYLTPVMYSVDIVPQELRNLFMLNPMTPITIAYRDILYYAKAPDLSTLLMAAGILFMILGSVRGETEIILRKAINICMECIGLG